MDPFTSMKEYYVACGSGTTSDDRRVPLPQPREDRHETALTPFPFLMKTYYMVDSTHTNHIVSWNRGGHSFVVWNHDVFCRDLLPTCFKHNNFSSFIRQLNTYGFRKIDPHKWEFANQWFVRGQKHLLKNIKRRQKIKTPPPPPPSPPPPPPPPQQFLRSDESAVNSCDELVREQVELKQRQQTTMEYIQEMDVRLNNTQHEQQEVISFLTRGMQNDACLQQSTKHKEKRKEHEDEDEVEDEERTNNKRMRPVEHTRGESSRMESNIERETREFGFQVSELETLALEIQGYRRTEMEKREKVEEEALVDEGLWNQLLSNQNFESGIYTTNTENEDISLLANQIAYLSSNRN